MCVCVSVRAAKHKNPRSYDDTVRCTCVALAEAVADAVYRCMAWRAMMGFWVMASRRWFGWSVYAYIYSIDAVHRTSLRSRREDRRERSASLIKESPPCDTMRHVINELCMTDICDNAYLCGKIVMCVHVWRLLACVYGGLCVWCVGVLWHQQLLPYVRYARFCAKAAEMLARVIRKCFCCCC